MKIYVNTAEERDFTCAATARVFVCTQSDPSTGLTADNIVYTADDVVITADAI